MHRDIHTYLQGVPTLAPAVYTADTEGEAVDRRGGGFYAHAAVAVVHAGSYSDGSHAFSLQHRERESEPWEDVAPEDLRGELPVIDTADAAGAVYAAAYLGTKRYLRLRVAVSGAGDGAAYSGLILLGRPRYAGRHGMREA